MKRAWFVLVLFVLSCSTAHRPAPTGTITGVVMSDGAPLPGATVTLTAQGQPTQIVVTDASGLFSFAGLAFGEYRVVTQLAGFNAQSYRVAVTKKAGVTLNAEMRVSSISEAITVTASAVDVSEVEVSQPAKEPGFVDTKTERVATFAIDVDRASYANVRRHLLNGVAPPPESIRIEEMVNYFTYSYPQPSDNVPFSVTTEVAGCPWNSANRLVRIGIQVRRLGIDEFTRSAAAADQSTIQAAIDQLTAGGSTAGGEGIELAYAIAQQNFLPNGNNRVILATDGDFDVGVTSMDGLERLIEKKRESDIFLSVIGVGDIWNDDMMEMLADKGNGNYSYLDSLAEAEKVFRHDLTGTLVTIAKDVKVQLEFDPKTVKSYRQIGYENRALATKDFDDDAKDAGELGAGHSVTALFEIVPATSQPARLATLRLRYKDPAGKKSKPLLAEVVDDGKSAYDASPDLQFAAAVTELGMVLRDSPHKGTATWDDVFHLARVSQGADLDGTRTEFVQLAEKARRLK